MFHKNLQIYRLFIVSIYLGGTPIPGIKSVAINVKTGVVFPTHRYNIMFKPLYKSILIAASFLPLSFMHTLN